ncbi:MAG: SRPBCC family protein [Gemmatimonadaceae bacterium]
MSELSHRLERSVDIHAPCENVFRFLTDSPRWATWWGAGSTIDARPGGRYLIRYPNGVEATGEVLAVEPPRRIVFTYGYVKGEPIAPGSSRITITLDSHAMGTRLHLTHEFAVASVRDEHIQGWRYQLALFSNVVADELNARAAAVVDAWFELWAEPDEKKREQSLTRLAAPDLRFQDRFGNTDGVTDLLPHVSAAQRFMPGFRMRREGDVRHCQGTVLANWVAVAPDGHEHARGTNVFVVGPSGKLQAVTGFWERV